MPNFPNKNFIRLNFFLSLWVAYVNCLGAPLPKSETNIYHFSSSWTDDDGRTVSLSEWQGRSTIIAMAYSDCTRVCSSTLRKLKEIEEIANTQHLLFEIIVVSFDPTTDTQEAWKFYRKKNNLVGDKRWHFLTGTDLNTKKLAHLLGVNYWMGLDHIIHDFRIVYVNSDGTVKSILDWDNQDAMKFLEP